MKKIISILLMLAVIAGILSGCGNSKTKAVDEEKLNQEAKEFDTYVNKDMKILHNDFIKIKADVDEMSSLATNEDLINAVKDNFVPGCRKCVKEAKNVKLNSKELIRLKGMYVTVLELYIEGLGYVSRGVSELEESDVQTGKGIIDEANKIYGEYTSQIKKLGEKHKVVVVFE